MHLAALPKSISSRPPPSGERNNETYANREAERMGEANSLELRNSESCESFVSMEIFGDVGTRLGYLDFKPRN
jgi:hypothetical protein